MQLGIVHVILAEYEKNTNLVSEKSEEMGSLAFSQHLCTELLHCLCAFFIRQ